MATFAELLKLHGFWSIITTITEVFMRMFDPPHPGEVLSDYLDNISVTAAAAHLGVTRATLSRILNGSAGISAEMALRLSDALGTSPELWIGMQSNYDLWQASKKHPQKLKPLLVA
jgi:addiction module HigA family antidote